MTRGKAETSFANRSSTRVRRLIPSLSRSIRFEVHSCHRWPTGSKQISSDSSRFASCHSAGRVPFLIRLPDLAEPLGLGATPEVENRPDDGPTSVG